MYLGKNSKTVKKIKNPVQRNGKGHAYMAHTANQKPPRHKI